MSLFDKQKIEWIPVKQLAVIWPKAQRGYIPGRAQAIADNFDPDKFGVLHVTKPNGKGIYHVYEGQHRAKALEIKYGEDERAPCVVADDIDEQMAAELFLGMNGPDARKPPSQIDTFKVAVTAKRPVEVAVNTLANDLGYTISAAKSAKTIMACTTLTSIYNRFGSDILRATLVAIKATWGWDANAVASPILSGYAAFLREFGHKLEHKRLIQKMERKYTPGRLLASARALKEGGFAPNSTAAIVELIISTYNTGVRGKEGLLKRQEKK